VIEGSEAPAQKKSSKINTSPKETKKSKQQKKNKKR
jgi:hypothetical protein